MTCYSFDTLRKAAFRCNLLALYVLDKLVLVDQASAKVQVFDSVQAAFDSLDTDMLVA